MVEEEQLKESEPTPEPKQRVPATRVRKSMFSEIAEQGRKSNYGLQPGSLGVATRGVLPFSSRLLNYKRLNPKKKKGQEYAETITKKVEIKDGKRVVTITKKPNKSYTPIGTMQQPNKLSKPRQQMNVFGHLGLAPKQKKPIRIPSMWNF